ncbi:hypothetical protein DRP04_12990 [Archaeoglobales archaeon]|nr:MAG: hypothetical protein DRP04_12990 [Archaeoglobales archaeon]
MKLITTGALILLTLSVILPVAAAQDEGFALPALDPRGWFESGFSWLGERLKEALAGALKWMVESIISLLVYIPPPHETGTKDFWTESFNIYISVLLPLALVVVGLYTMFSSQPVNVSLFEGIIKRIAFATALAFFSFTIIDTLVQFFNKLSLMIVVPENVNVDQLLKALLVEITIGGAAIVAILAALLIGVLEFALIFLVFLILGLRIVIVHFVAGAMPILCFLYIIGVGPLRRLSELADLLWGLGVVLPAFSIIGAGLVKLALYATQFSTLQGGGFLGLVFILASFGAVLTYPWLASSFMSMFAGVISPLSGAARPISWAATGALQRRFLRHYAAFGKAAPLTVLFPSKLAAGVAHRFDVIRSRMGDMLRDTRARTGSLRQNILSRISKAEALARANVSGADIGTIAIAAEESGLATPDHAPEAFERLSQTIASFANKARGEEIGTLRTALSAIFNKDLSVKDALEKAIKTNIGYAVSKQDMGVVGLSAMLLASKDEKTLSEFFAKHKELAASILKSRIAKAILAAHGVSERDLIYALRGDELVIRKIASALENTPTASNTGWWIANTFNGLVSGASVDELDKILMRELASLKQAKELGADYGAYDRVVKALAEAANVSPEIVERAVEDDVFRRDLAERLVYNRDRSVESLAGSIAVSSIALPDMSDEEAARKLSEFIRAGGYITAQIDASTAKELKGLSRLIAREHARQAALKVHVGTLAGDFFDELLYGDIARRAALTYKYKRWAAPALVEAQVPMHPVYYKSGIIHRPFYEDFDEFVDYEMERI